MDEVVYYRSEQIEIIHYKNRPIIYSEHNHVSVYIIGLVTYGRIMLKCNGPYTAYPSNSFFIIAPYQAHTLSLPDVYDMLTVCVNKDLIVGHTPVELFGTLSKTLAKLVPSVNTALLATSIDALYCCKASPQIDSIILSSAHSLWQNPEDNNCLQEMADETYYSLYHYIKRFKRYIGMTPHKFRVQNRVRKAQRMIESGELLTDIALNLGFYDQSHFIKCFKSVIGLTPSEYKSSVKIL